MFSNSRPPPQAGGTPHFNTNRPATPLPTALGGFSVCVALPTALLSAFPIWAYTAEPVYEFLSDIHSTPVGLIGQFVWVGLCAAAIFFIVAGMTQTVLGALGARLKLALFSFSPWRSRR